jgi:hypothetical protein
MFHHPLLSLEWLSGISIHGKSGKVEGFVPEKATEKSCWVILYGKAEDALNLL